MNPRKSSWVGLVLVMAAWTSGCGETEWVRSEAVPEPAASSSAPLIEVATHLWSYNLVHICFVNHPSGNQINVFKQALLDTWSSVAGVDFSFYDSCAGLPVSARNHIEVTWLGTENWQNLFGKSNLGEPVGATPMPLAFCDATLNDRPDLGPDCSQEVPKLRAVAVHEIGHALGLAHSHKEPERPAWCAAPTPITEDWVFDSGVVGAGYTHVCRGNGVGSRFCTKNADCQAGATCAANVCGCVNSSGCQNGASCSLVTHTCGAPDCSLTVVVPADDFFTIIPYDGASIMNYCRDTDGIPGPENPPAYAADTLSPGDILQARLMYGGRPYDQALFDSAGFRTSSGWISSGNGKLAPEYYSNGALSSVFAAPIWLLNSTQVAQTLELPASQLPLGSQRTAVVLYDDPWGIERNASESVERNPSKFAAIATPLLAAR